MGHIAVMTQTLKIDFVSDVVCPWCAVGLGGLNQALERLKAEGIEAEISFRPFELNPQMAAEGENVTEHIGRKYGSTPEQSAKTRELITARAAAAGFTMNMTAESRIWNTFDAHRLIHWAGEKGPAEQGRMKAALLKTHFTDGQPLNEASTLAAAATEAGLDAGEALAVLAEGRYAQVVRDEEKGWVARGINSVPAVVVENKWLISGGQPAEVFEQALRQMAAEARSQAG